MYSSLDTAVLVTLIPTPEPLTFHSRAALNCLPRVCDALFIEEEVKRFNTRTIIFWRETRVGMMGVSPLKVSDNYDRQHVTMVRSEYVGESFIASVRRFPPTNY